MDMGNYTDVIYMDFQKAFTVSRKRLISKLKTFDIRNKLIKLIEAFITDDKR